MKLLNHTLRYLSVSLLGILGVWATILYFQLLDEVYDSLDDGLDNHKELLIQRALTDSAFLHPQPADLLETNYALREISPPQALSRQDRYADTLMYMQNEDDLEPVRMLTTVFATPDHRYYELKVVSSMVEEDDLIEDLLYSLLWLYLALLVSIVLVNNLLLRRIWHPFYHLLAQLKTFRLGQGTVQPAPTRVEEFQTLNETVVRLLQRNQATYQSQKQFLENIAHELQTPLAISLNKLELLAEAPDLTAAHLETVGKVMQTLERLTRLNKSLLLLSRIENRQFLAESPIAFHTLVPSLLDELHDLAAFRKVALHYTHEATLTRTLNRELAETLVVNLLKNAITHNHPGGRVDVQLTAAALRVTNTGTPTPLDKAKIFERFYHNERQAHTTGLGLAIVKAIADVYGYHLSYRFSDATGHTFEVGF
ncbi:Signal transduction histidine kinase [Catalinimonas alkaloidigena]|uniref:histidine kinase n=1 Tax=Catalinimonas alkaloidigena TaxID=1075417 RepID=A0A1G8XE57_9BACT|nr:HAMP domain-containing sensor histidine kinase [Catalinimonas alkaloidigena]SDJ88687.1 Signal transduction histidine kinase [Catalinimonas alkaloidigena]